MSFLVTILSTVLFIPSLLLTPLCMVLIAARLLPMGKTKTQKIIPYLFFLSLMLTNVWIGDFVPLLVTPAFLLLFFFCYAGSYVAKIIVGVLFYTLFMSVSMLATTISSSGMLVQHNLSPIIKFVFAVLMWLLVHKLTDRNSVVNLSSHLWLLLCGLTVAPFFATISFSILGLFQNSPITTGRMLSLALFILPFVLISSIAIFVTALKLSHHQKLVQAHHFAEMRELYYQGIQQEQLQVRILRHDLNQHLSTLRMMLEENKNKEVQQYLESLTQSSNLQNTKHISDNQTVNTVINSKMSIMKERNIRADFNVSLPQVLPVSDIDLVALLGNAFDNAIEASASTETPYIFFRARADKGLIMLQIKNPYIDPIKKTKDEFLSTKSKKGTHGFGIKSIQEIVSRYSGTMDITSANDVFELLIYLPL